MQSADNQGRTGADPYAPEGGYSSEPERTNEAPTEAGGWAPTEAAADFLGLDPELAQQNTSGANGEASAPVDGSHSWLLSLEGEEPRHESTATATTSAEDGDPGEAPETTEAPETLGELEETADEPPVSPDRPSHHLRTLLIAAGTLVLAGGGWFGWQALQQRTAAPVADVPVATRPSPTKRPAPIQDATPAGAATKGTDTAVLTNAPAAGPEAVDSGATTTGSATSAPEPTGQPLGTEPGSVPDFAFGTRSSDPRVERFLHGLLGLGVLAEDGLSNAPTTPRSTAPLGGIASDTGLPNEGGEPPFASEGSTEVVTDVSDSMWDVRTPTGRSKLRHATEADMAGVWGGTTLPLEAIDQPGRLKTPRVGRVRVTIHGGELFEGRLYAVGDEHVWLDTELGRMGLAGSLVKRIDHLSSPDGTPVLGGRDSQELAGLPRVRVRTPGGMLYGRVVGRDERSVTLVIDGGARVTIDSTEVEPAPEGRSLIVRGQVPAPPGS